MNIEAELVVSLRPQAFMFSLGATRKLHGQNKTKQSTHQTKRKRGRCLCCIKPLNSPSQFLFHTEKCSRMRLQRTVVLYMLIKSKFNCAGQRMTLDNDSSVHKSFLDSISRQILFIEHSWLVKGYHANSQIVTVNWFEISQNMPKIYKLLLATRSKKRQKYTLKKGVANINI